MASSSLSGPVGLFWASRGVAPGWVYLLVNELAENLALETRSVLETELGIELAVS
jgi:hypothetical protein